MRRRPTALADIFFFVTALPFPPPPFAPKKTKSKKRNENTRTDRLLAAAAVFTNDIVNSVSLSTVSWRLLTCLVPQKETKTGETIPLDMFFDIECGTTLRSRGKDSAENTPGT